MDHKSETEGQIINFTVKEAAKILGCCEAKILNMIGDGRMLAFRVGREYQIPPYEVRRIQAEAFETQRRKVEKRLEKRRQAEMKKKARDQ